LHRVTTHFKIIRRRVFGIWYVVEEIGLYLYLCTWISDIMDGQKNKTNKNMKENQKQQIAMI